MDLKTLRALLEVAWCAETAYGDWNPRVPSLNQCYVTALVVQKYFGGKLPSCKMTDGDTHCWNILPDGVHVDLTEDQFNFFEGKPIKEKNVIRNRKRLLSINSTRQRYELLVDRIDYLITLTTKANIPAN